MRPGTPPPARGLRFAPPLLWMGVIAILSSSLFGADRTGSLFLALAGHLLPGAAPETLEGLHLLTRKLGHIAEYAILAVLWARALAPGRGAGRAAGLAVAAAALYALADEARQGLTPNRTPSLGDVGLDTLGALLGALAWLRAGARGLRGRRREAAGRPGPVDDGPAA